jgi:hypothetical protein
MEKEFLLFLMKYGEVAARDKFEEMCTRLAQSIYKSSAQPVKADPGDFGIDIFIGDMSEAIDVFQCKFFAKDFADVQKKQIRDSFKTAIETKEYRMKSWTLCLPLNLTLGQHKWWAKWSSEQRRNNKKLKIRLINASMLIGLSKTQRLFNELFEREEMLILEKILLILKQQELGMKEVLKKPKHLDYSGNLFTYKLTQAGINDHHDLIKTEFYNAEILRNNIESRGIAAEVEELHSLTENVHRLWVTQYMGYDDEVNGRKLLHKTYESLESQYDRALETKVIRVSEVEKRGVLHQLSDRCEIGWIRNYKSKF